MIEPDPCPSGQAGLPDDKEREIRVGERLISGKHAVKWALIGVCMGWIIGMVWIGYGQGMEVIWVD